MNIGVLKIEDCVKAILRNAKKEPEMSVFEFLRRLELADPSNYIKDPEDVQEIKIATQYVKLMVETMGVEEAYKILV